MLLARHIEWDVQEFHLADFALSRVLHFEVVKCTARLRSRSCEYQNQTAEQDALMKSHEDRLRSAGMLSGNPNGLLHPQTALGADAQILHRSFRGEQLRVEVGDFL
jgi:hypothetical protein